MTGATKSLAPGILKRLQAAIRLWLDRVERRLHLAN